MLREHVLPAPYVFEDIAPRPVRFDGRTGLLTVRAGPGGAQLALFAADRNDPARIELLALGEDLGGPNRWMAPSTDGRHLMAVHTPHIGGDLFDYTLEGDQNGMRLRVLSAADGWQERPSIALPAQVVMTVRLPGEGAMAVLMVGGAVGVVHV